MATRKTNIIYEIIEQSSDKNILMITNRRSLAQECYSKYKKYNFKYYENKDYEIGDNLIVQFDSLYKYNIQHFDIIIIDEITSLLLHISEPYNSYDQKNNKYRYNIESLLNIDNLPNKKIILLDAFIIYHPFQGKELSLINTFREKIKVIEYMDKHTFISKIIFKSQKETISVSSNEKRTLQKIKDNLSKKGIKCLLLTADTEDKDKIFKDLQNCNNLEEYGYSVLLYSPVVTTGVSFLFNIDNHFHFDNSKSIDPINSIQMIRRIRNAKTIHYYIQGKISYKSTNIEKIKKSSQTLEIFQMLNKRGMFLGLTEAGEKLGKIIKIKNILSNTHKYAFRELMKFQFLEVNINTFKMDPFKL
jgi:hypothetical protein